MRATAILAVVLVLVASSLALPTKKEYAPPVSGTKGLASAGRKAEARSSTCSSLTHPTHTT